MKNSIQFLGASGTVTGSKYLLNLSGNKYLVDAGVFQGERKWREKNWDKLEFDPKEIKAVFLTHAHIDHTGFLPRLYKLGLNCPVYATNATYDLCKLLLPDMGYLQEEEANFRNKKGKSRHKPALPLYTEKEAYETLNLFKPIAFHKEIKIDNLFSVTWHRTGHILGAGAINLKHKDISITFSGDLGRFNVPILKDPENINFGDLLLIESTYGNRLHNDIEPKTKLKEVINQTYNSKGVLVIPSFAVGRAQTLLYYLRELKSAKEIPDLPIILDSPMSCDATSIYKNNTSDYDEEALEIKKSGKCPFTTSKLAFIKDTDSSKKLNSINEPMIIISASGMLTGGRILHHLAHRISNPKNTILFVGYQPKGGRGDWILQGAKSMKLFGDDVDINAKIEQISGFSAHADQSELLKWCKQSNTKPKKVAVVHGEEESAKTFSELLKTEMSYNTFCPSYLEKLEF